MKKIIPFLLFTSLVTPVAAEISDYDIRRLPASVANEFQNANGDTRLFIPTSINNQGHLSGMRLTLKQGANPEIENDFTEASYIYDLNNRNFIAQSIPGTSIVQIGEGYYISKRLHPSGNRWQTFRCGYSLEGNNEIIPNNNPACELIDNDYIGYTAVNLNPATWRNLYKISLILLKNAAPRVTTFNGDAFVADFTNDPENAVKANIYLKNGNSISSDSIISLLRDNGFPEMDTNTLENSFIALNNTESSNPSLILSIPQGNNFILAKIDLITMEFSEGSSPIANSDPLINIIGISQSGLIYYEGGLCNSEDLCENRNTLDTSSIESFKEANNLINASASSEIFVDSEGKASFFKYCFLNDQNSNASNPCESDIYFVSETNSDFLIESIPNAISSKFSENVIQSPPYGYFSGNITNENRDASSFFTEGSPNGKYLVVVVPTTAKEQQAYVFMRN